jgi:hypothetical protein
VREPVALVLELLDLVDLGDAVGRNVSSSAQSSRAICTALREACE